MTATLSTDPFTITYARLVQMAKDWTPFWANIKPGNLLNFSELPQSKVSAKVKSIIQHADRPEAGLYIESGGGNDFKSSCGAEILQSYVWRLVSANQNLGVDGAFLPVMWELWRAMYQWDQVGGLTELVWNNKSFVKRFKLTGFTQGLVQDGDTKNIKGWAGVLTFEAQLVFAKADISNPLI